MSRFPISLADPRVPAPLLCVLVLLVASAFQFVLPTAPELPPHPAVITHFARTPGVSTTATAIPPSILARPIFAPRIALAMDGSPAVVTPLGGAAIAGVVTVGRARYAIVRDPTGVVSHVRLGSSLSGWRIAALESDGATLTKGSESVHLAYGAAASAAAAKSDTEEESE